MKLFWSTRSPFVRKVMIVVHELGLEGRIELIRTIVHPAKPNPDVMIFNPLSKIPTLVLEDLTALYDSRVICDYLDATWGGKKLVPATGADRWQVLTWQALADGVMETALLWLSERARTDTARAQDILSGCALKIFTALDLLERDDRFFTGQEAGLGQIAMASALLYLDFRFGDLGWRDGRQRLRDWFETFSARPSVGATAFADIY